MSRYACESSDDSDWVHLTPPGEQSLQSGSTRYFIDVEDETSADQQSFGGTQNPRPPTNPRPRPPRQSLTYVDDDSWRPTTSGSTARYYSRDPLNDADVFLDRASATQLGPETRRSSRDHRIDTWSRDNDEQEFHHRTIVPQYRYADQGGQYASSFPLSDTLSMAMTAEMRTTNYLDTMASSRAPSLISSRSTRRASGVSARTDSISSMPSRYILDEADDGSPIVREDQSSARGRFQCPLAFLGCREWFEDPRQWETHHQPHFRGRLPRSIHCPFTGCGERFRAESSREAWGIRWNHIVNCPYRTSGISARPTSSLVDHLWRNGIISNAQEQQLRQAGSLDDIGRNSGSSSTSRNRRRERRPEDYRSPRAPDYDGGTYFPSRR